MILLLLALLSAAGVYFLGGNRISPAHVEQLYAEGQMAFNALDHEALCAMLDAGFRQELTVHVDSGQSRESADKQAYCQSQAQILGALQQVSQRANGRRLVDHQYTITGIAIESGGRSATVQTRAITVVPGIRSTVRSTDTLVRRRWKTVVVRSEGTAWIGPAR